MTELNPVDVLRLAFPELSDVALAPLASLTRQATFAAGELICREGEQGDAFYIIGAGEVAFTKHFTDEEERQLRTGGPGVYFGEMALLQDEPRNANVRAVSEVHVLVIEKTAFQEAIQANPVMMLDIMRTLIERMRANDATALAELRRQKEEIEAAYAQLRRQEEERSVFLTTLAHELRTPLTAASGYMQLITVGEMSGPALSMGLGKIRDNVDRIVSLVNDLLFVQEQDLIEPVLREVDLLELFEIVVGDVRAAAEKCGAEITIITPPDLPHIQADSDGLTRVFRNLLENAVKFSPEGGAIRIVARKTPRGVTIEFRDEGVGIPAAFMPYLFKRFQRTEEIGGHLFGGMGLGLAIARHIIESHGGTITVESVEGEGSTFTVVLPPDGGRAQIETGAGDADPWQDASVEQP